MEQEKLEERVREIWQQQDFEFEGDTPFFKARNGEDFSVAVFSSDKYGAQEVKDKKRDQDHVFVDEGLKGIDVEVSVIRKREEKTYDMPSFELIGDIAVINDLAGRDESEAVEAIKEHHPFIKTVLLKEKPLSGEFRVGDYRKLTGEETETDHTEHGCLFKVDPTKVYYSERYSSERQKVVSDIEPGEEILVMFAGVGPFAILAASLSEPERVVAVEKNPVAAEYLRENIEFNNVEDTVEGIEGDVREEVPDLDKFDRIIMPLPGSAHEFLELAYEHLKPEGILNYYRFVEGDHEEFILNELGDLGLDMDYVDSRSSGDRSPSEERVCYKLKKN